jgi:predicted nucleic acid-binding protein
MSEARSSGVVVDTMVISWLFDDRPNPLADTYRKLIDGEPVVLAFQTVMELRFGALRAGWGELRRRRLERRIAEIAVVQPDDEMIMQCAELRSRSQQAATPSETSSMTATDGSPQRRSDSTCRSHLTTSSSRTHPDCGSSPPTPRADPSHRAFCRADTRTHRRRSVATHVATRRSSREHRNVEARLARPTAAPRSWVRRL